MPCAILVPNASDDKTLGRGLRPLRESGGGNVSVASMSNTLTVIAVESYEQFAENLQKEIENDTGIRFWKGREARVLQIWSLLRKMEPQYR